MREIPQRVVCSNASITIACDILETPFILSTKVIGTSISLAPAKCEANAISIWMILSTYGPHGWMEKIFILQKRTDWLCEQLGENNIPFYRNPNSNIVTLKKEIITQEIAHKFGLIPDNHNEPNWFKIVIMDQMELRTDIIGLKVPDICNERGMLR